MKLKAGASGCLIFQRRGQTLPGNECRVYLLLIFAALAALLSERPCLRRS